MSISTAERPINIKDLILEEPERARELPFDPEKEITREDWRKMLTTLEGLRMRMKGRKKEDVVTAILQFSKQAMEMKLLFPERARDLHLDEEAWEKMENQLLEDYTDTASASAQLRHFLLAMRMKLLYPERAAGLTFDSQTWERGVETIQGYRRKEFIPIFIQDALAMKILSSKWSQKLGLNDEVWAWAGGQLIQDKTHDQKRGAWESFPFFVMPTRLLFPDRVQEFGLDSTVWQGMRATLQRQRQSESMIGFTDLAFAMKILAAEDARIREDGQISITMRKPRTDFAPPTPPMPEVRRF